MEQKMPKKSRKQAKRKKKSLPKIQYYSFKRNHVRFCRTGTKPKREKYLKIFQQKSRKKFLIKKISKTLNGQKIKLLKKKPNITLKEEA